MTVKPAPIDPPEVHDQLWRGFAGKVGWDIGSNTGTSLPEMALRASLIHAFEPSVECLPQLRKAAAAQGRGRNARVEIHEVAVSDTDGSVDLLAVPEKMKTGQLVTGNVTDPEWSPEQTGAVFRSVPSRTVDSLVEEFGAPPNFCKVDVEGHEGRVLSGATKTIQDHSPSWLIEIHSTELGRWCRAELKSCGYRVEVIRHPYYPEGSQFWDHHYWIKAFPG